MSPQSTHIETVKLGVLLQLYNCSSQQAIEWMALSSLKNFASATRIYLNASRVVSTDGHYRNPFCSTRQAIEQCLPLLKDAGLILEEMQSNSRRYKITPAGTEYLLRAMHEQTVVLEAAPIAARLRSTRRSL